MNEPILSKNFNPHGYDYKPLTLEALETLKRAAQKVANRIKCPVYLVGSAQYKEAPRDIDVSIIMPVKRHVKMFGELPTAQEQYSKYLYDVFHKSFKYTRGIHFCIPYHLDIKVCPDTWWPEKQKTLLAEPNGLYKYLLSLYR